MNTDQQGRKRPGYGEPGDILPPKTSRNNGTSSQNVVFGPKGGNLDDRSEEEMEVEVVYQRQNIKVFIAYDEENPPYELLERVRSGLKAKGVTVLDDVTPGTQTIKETARAINEVTTCTCLFLLTKNATRCPFYTIKVIQAIEKAQREGKLGGIFLTHGIGDADIPDTALLRILPRFTLQFTDNGHWRPSQIEGVLRKITDDTPINFVLPVGNVAHAQAWSHIIGYYVPVMPFLEDRIKSFKFFMPSNMPVCVYELIPKTCDIPRLLEEKDPSIQRAGQLDKIVVNRAGNKDRTYMSYVYHIREGQQDYYCVAEYPNVLSAIDKMEKSKIIKMNNIEKKTQVKRFANTLRAVINHHTSTLCGVIRVLYFDDENEKPRDVLLRAIKADLAAQADDSGTQTVTNTANITNRRYECDAYIVCSDSDTRVANQIWDFLTKHDKIVDGCGSRCGPEFQSLQRAIENSRWVILLLSEKSLTDFRMDYSMIEILNNGVERHDLNILPVLINLEEKHVPDALRWIGFLEMQSGYEERLLKCIEGNDVPFALDSTCLPAWNIGYTLAWGYVVNYIQTVFDPNAATSFYYCLPRALRIRNINCNNCPRKLYLLVPHSGKCTGLVDHNCKYVMHTVTFAEIDDLQGAANIYKSLDVYKITDPAKKEIYHMVCQFPTSILTLCNMNESKMAGLNDQTVKEEADRFCTTLNLLMHGPVGRDIADSCEIVHYDDSTPEGLPNKIIPLIKRDIGVLQSGST